MLRRLIAWLLIASLPVQGLAMSAMAVCGPAHERMAAVQWVPDSVQLSMSGNPHNHGQNHRSVTTDHSAPSLAFKGAATGDSVQAAGGFGDFSCSACAACCVGSALPASSALTAVAPSSLDFFRPAAGRALIAVALDGLERPPRFS